MATIDDLEIPIFDDLTDEQLTSLIRGVRSRRTAPVKEVRQAATKKAISRKGQREKKPVSATAVASQFDSLPDEQKRQLMKQLMGE